MQTFSKPCVEQLETRLTPTTTATPRISIAIGNLEASMPTSTIDASQVNMQLEMDAPTFQTALAAGTLTLAQATTQRDALLVEVNQIKARLDYINAEVSDNSLLSRVQMIGYWFEIRNFRTRVAEIDLELTRLSIFYPNMPPPPGSGLIPPPYVPGPSAPVVPQPAPAPGD